MNKVQIKTSKTGLLVPVVNEVHLHSIYDPEKEAESFADKNIEKIQKNDKILILGLGFGYHVKAIEEKMKQFHRTYEIVVLEPDQELIKEYKKKFEVDFGLFNSVNAAAIYENYDFVDFLMDKPAVIAHPNSFNLHTNFFKQFLGYAAPKNPKNYEHLLNPVLKSYFDNEDMDLADHIQKIDREGNKFTGVDYFIMSFNELCR